MSGLTPTDLVQLPRMTGGGALAFGQQLIAAGTGQKGMPKPVAKAYSILASAHAELQTAMVAQFGAATTDTPADEPAVQELDRVLDNCWGGIDDRLVGLTKLPAGTPGAAEAGQLRKRLFPGGLSFLKLPYKLQWSESQLRLDLIERDNLAPQIHELCGKPFLPAVVEAHGNYGRALGMVEPLPGAAETPLVRGALDAFTKAVRSYVVKVIGSVDDDVPATQTLADTLLAPLARWTSSVKRAKDGASPVEGPGEGAAAPDAAAPADK